MESIWDMGTIIDQGCMEDKILEMNNIENMKTFDFKDLKSQKEALLKELGEMEIPTPSISIDFTVMQKLFAYWVKKKHYYGNWSGTGVGKTYSFILASRVIDSHLTVVIGTNSTTHQLASEITDLYEDSVVVVYDGVLPDFDMTKHNYLIFNYEKGQQMYSQELFDSVLDMYKVDYIVFDEVQMVKQTGKYCSVRRKLFQTFRNNAVERYDSYVSVLTATPYTNNIKEVISILSLMTGKSYGYLHTKNLLKNTADVENLLNSLGIRATTEARNIAGKVVEENIHIEEIEGDDRTFSSFKSSIECGPLAIYQSVLKDKLEYIYLCDKIKKGELSIIYTQFTDGIVDQAKEFFTSVGFKVCEYTGKNKDTVPFTDKYGKVNWEGVKEHYDIILASKPIAVGIDGLQKVCNNLIIISLPWTHADFTQLVGRIKRKMSNYDYVNVCIPVVRFPQANMVGYDDKVWNSIENKGVYSDACLNGEFPKEVRSLHQSIIRKMKSEMKMGYVYAA